MLKVHQSRLDMLDHILSYHGGTSPTLPTNMACYVAPPPVGTPYGNPWEGGWPRARCPRQIGASALAAVAHFAVGVPKVLQALELRTALRATATHT